MKQAKLKILQLHPFFRQKGKGGSVGALFGLIDLLEANGHAVPVFSSKSPDNRPSQYAKYFFDPVAISQEDDYPLTTKLRLARKVISSKETAEKLEEMLEDISAKGEKPVDIAHIHSVINHLTPSVIKVLKKYKIPVIQTLHDYQLICPNYKLFTKGQVCERCKKKKYYQCFFNKCVQDSYARSFLAMVERYWNRVFQDYAKDIDLFIAPSRFMKEKVVEFGIPAAKVKVLPYYLPFEKIFVEEARETENLIETNEIKSKSDGPGDDYALFFGRLAREKGIDSLIQAFKQIKDSRLKLKIVGMGPQEAELKQLRAKLGLEARIEFLGFKPREELLPLIRAARFVVYPSVWYENSPLTIYESLYLNKPVLASEIGGQKELILNNENGYLFEPGNSKDLAAKINLLTREQADLLGAQGRQSIENKLQRAKYYAKLLAIYQQVQQVP